MLGHLVVAAASLGLSQLQPACRGQAGGPGVEIVRLACGEVDEQLLGDAQVLV
jgi:hypothetical protein